MNIYLTDEELSLLQSELYSMKGYRLEHIERTKKTLGSMPKDNEFLEKHRKFLESHLEEIKHEYEVLEEITNKLERGG